MGVYDKPQLGRIAAFVHLFPRQIKRPSINVHLSSPTLTIVTMERRSRNCYYGPFRYILPVKSHMPTAPHHRPR